MPGRYAGLTLSAWKQAGCTSRITFPPARTPIGAHIPSRGAPSCISYCAASVIGFAVPYLGSSVLALHHDLYLAIYFASVLALCAAYVRRTALDVRSTLSRHWKLGSLLGLVFGVALVRNVLTEDATPHPDGAYYVLS